MATASPDTDRIKDVLDALNEVEGLMIDTHPQQQKTSESENILSKTQKEEAPQLQQQVQISKSSSTSRSTSRSISSSSSSASNARIVSIPSFSEASNHLNNEEQRHDFKEQTLNKRQDENNVMMQSESGSESSFDATLAFWWMATGFQCLFLFGATVVWRDSRAAAVPSSHAYLKRMKKKDR